MDTPKIIILFLLVIPLVSAANYGEGNYNCGLFNIGCEETAEVSEPTAGGQEIAQPTAMTGQLCNMSNGFVWYNEVCYKCEGEIAEIDGKILCVICPEGFILKDGECKATIEQKIQIPAIIVIFAVVIIITVLLSKKSKKQQKKQYQKLKKKFEKGGKEGNIQR